MAGCRIKRISDATSILVGRSRFSKDFTAKISPRLAAGAKAWRVSPGQSTSLPLALELPRASGDERRTSLQFGVTRQRLQFILNRSIHPDSLNQAGTKATGEALANCHLHPPGAAPGRPGFE